MADDQVQQPSMIVDDQYMAPLQEMEAVEIETPPPPTTFKLFGFEVNVTSHSNNHDHPPPPPPKSIRLLGVDVIPDVNSKPNTEKMTCPADHDHQRKRKSASVIDDEEKTSSEKSISPSKRNPSSSPHEASAASSSSSSPPPPPPLPEFHPRVMQLLEEHHHELLENLPKLLFEKRLEESDVRKNQNRLLITGSERLEAALTEEERRKVGSTSAVLEVITTDPRGVDFKLRLKSWPGMGVKVLNHEWFKLVAANGIQKGDTVQGWGFRAGAGQQFRLAFKVSPNTSAT